jgi:hypothetical protein
LACSFLFKIFTQGVIVSFILFTLSTHIPSLTRTYFSWIHFCDRVNFFIFVKNEMSA